MSCEVVVTLSCCDHHGFWSQLTQAGLDVIVKTRHHNGTRVA
jgi:hypothetical protein